MRKSILRVRLELEEARLSGEHDKLAHERDLLRRKYAELAAEEGADPAAMQEITRRWRRLAKEVAELGQTLAAVRQRLAQMENAA